MTIVNDTISYLDIGDYLLKGEWSTALSLAANKVLSKRAYLASHWRFLSLCIVEYPVVHLVVFGIFLLPAGALISFSDN